jgi:hypothetical protein
MTQDSDILARITALESAIKSKAPVIPLIDPTANVLSLVAAAITRQDDIRTLETRRQDDLREQAERYIEQLAMERQRAEMAAKVAEAGRIDALLEANTNNVALALEKQGAQAQAQDKRIAALEQNQYQGVGGKMQQTESRESNQWKTGIIMGLIVAAVEIAMRIFGK